MSPYLKSIVQAGGAIVAAVAAVFASGDHTDYGEWINVAIIAVGAAQVWVAANYPGFPRSKLWASVATAVLTALASVLTGGITGTEIGQLVIAAVTALGVHQAPNRPTVARLHPS